MNNKGLRKIFVGTEMAKSYKQYDSLKEAREAARKYNGVVCRLHAIYDKKFIAYCVQWC